jgi:protein SCO1/2
VLATAPSFTFTDQDGRPFDSSALSGRVWVADFMFTRCRGLCPLLTERMNELQGRFSGEARFHLVSFTVDPEHDRPEVLGEYAREHGSDPGGWTYLTGEAARIQEVIGKGFLLAVGEGATAEEPISHSQRLVLVDGEGNIRGYYDSQDPGEMRLLAEHIARLLERAG